MYMNGAVPIKLLRHVIHFSPMSGCSNVGGISAARGSQGCWNDSDHRSQSFSLALALGLTALLILGALCPVFEGCVQT